MRRPAIVDTPYPTVWETAKRMGVSKKRTLELIKIADDIYDRHQQKLKLEQEASRKRRLKTA